MKIMIKYSDLKKYKFFCYYGGYFLFNYEKTCVMITKIQDIYVNVDTTLKDIYDEVHKELTIEECIIYNCIIID